MKVKAKHSLTHEGRAYRTGDVFETTDAKAKQLIDSGHAEEHKGEGGSPAKSPEGSPKGEGGASVESGKPEEE